ncbi:vitamin-D-receptor interacting mediator subunit 4-domain-containing protein [Armillaria novae-zelandiae]|uniref:Mediator of RNA polymerase II transcription subunit 4 n=1 Tax=Armillaria novae-zelandiae TaxID=153914 RepID=A0AA39PTX3_9AGAR|nr:vitamin-D-receptor interacting mediator subunit 4-domain-containing protein [Armillaria novae-zelandiae]
MSSMSSILLAPLTDLQILSQALFVSLSPVTKPPPPPPPPVSAFLACDQALASAVNTAHSHQIRQRKIEALKNEILELDARWREICMELEREKRELEAMIEEGSIPYPELLAYAQSLSTFTSAPPNMPDLQAGQPPPPLFFPPFPNEEKMRRGRLNAEAPLGLPGETHSIGAPTVSPKGPDANQMGPGANPYRQDLRAPQPQFFDLDLDLNPDL